MIERAEKRLPDCRAILESIFGVLIRGGSWSGFGLASYTLDTKPHPRNPGHPHFSQALPKKTQPTRITMPSRQERLKALKEKAQAAKKSSANDTRSTIEEDPPPAPLHFRNYNPKDDRLAAREAGGIGNNANNDDAEEEPKSKKQKTRGSDGEKSALQLALEETRKEQEESGNAPSGGLNLTLLAPKKINFDLKRDVADKLAKLEKRTQRAIVSLLRERLENEGDSEGDLD